MNRRRLAILAILALAWAAPAHAGAGEKLSFPIRGQTLTLTVYRPAAPVRGTIVIGSGDAGWVGLAVRMAELLSDEGYVIVGLNVRQYLAAFTIGALHLTIADARGDYRALSELLAHEGLLRHPVLLSGVSEGAALAVLAAGESKNHAWINGVVTMGLPARAELAWHWTDFAALIMKKDADEPSFGPYEYVGAVSPIPLAMIQSATDEYATDSDRSRLLAEAGAPKKMVLVPASNHRFTDKMPELRAAFLEAIAWTKTAGSETRR